MVECKYILVKGAGDLATGVALVLNQAGFLVVMTEIPQPTCVRRKVSFAEAVYQGEVWVEGVRGVRADDFTQAISLAEQGNVAVLIDPQGDTLKKHRPEIFIDATMAKKNLGTGPDDADVVIALGPGFQAGKEVDVVIETQRGSDLGKLIFSGYAIPDTGIPGDVLGYTSQRVLRAPESGIFKELKNFGDMVDQGEIVASVDDAPVRAKISGTVRGLLKSGLPVYQGMKVGDIHPEKNRLVAESVTDKAWTIGLGALKAISISRRKKNFDKRPENLKNFSRLLELERQGKTCMMYTLVDGEGMDEFDIGAHLFVVPGTGVWGSLGIPALDRSMILRANNHITACSQAQLIHWEIPWMAKTPSLAGKKIRVLEDIISPEKKLVIFGGGHISVPLAEMAAILGFRVIVIDDREEFANRNRFPGADKVICAEFRDVFRNNLVAGDIDATTHIVIVTRGHKEDKTCVQNLVYTQAAYIGMIGSRTKVKQTFESLLAEGFSKDDLLRISTPIGLDLGGQTPAEIALSILAEMIATNNRGTGKPLKELKGGILS